MAVKVRLKRFGNKDNPCYRVVVAPSQAPRDGKTIESIGVYNPMANPSTFNIDTDKLQHWLRVGAQLTETLQRLVATHYKSIQEAYPKRIKGYKRAS